MVNIFILNVSTFKSSSDETCLPFLECLLFCVLLKYSIATESLLKVCAFAQGCLALAKKCISLVWSYCISAPPLSKFLWIERRKIFLAYEESSGKFALDLMF